MSNWCINKRHQMGDPEHKNDECYTRRDTAIEIIDKYWCLLYNKKIIMPCDTPDSKLYQVAKEKGLDVEIAQDMYNVDYSKYDIVFTNPPFHGISKYIKWLDDQNIKFLLFTPWITATHLITEAGGLKNREIFYLYSCHRIFDQPDNNKIIVFFAIVTNIKNDFVINTITSKPDIRIQPTDEWQTYRGIWSDILGCNYLKYDWICNTNINNGKLSVKLKK